MLLLLYAPVKTDIGSIEGSSGKTVSYEEQIMSKDKYPSSYCVYYNSNLFRNARSFKNRGMFSDIPQFQQGNIRSCDVFRPIVHEREYWMDNN